MGESLDRLRKKVGNEPVTLAVSKVQGYIGKRGTKYVPVIGYKRRFDASPSPGSDAGNDSGTNSNVAGEKKGKPPGEPANASHPQGFKNRAERIKNFEGRSTEELTKLRDRSLREADESNLIAVDNAKRNIAADADKVLKDRGDKGDPGTNSNVAGERKGSVDDLRSVTTRPGSIAEGLQQRVRALDEQRTARRAEVHDRLGKLADSLDAVPNGPSELARRVRSLQDAVDVSPGDIEAEAQRVEDVMNGPGMTQRQRAVLDRLLMQARGFDESAKRRQVETPDYPQGSHPSRATEKDKAIGRRGREISDQAQAMMKLPEPVDPTKSKRTILGETPEARTKRRQAEAAVEIARNNALEGRGDPGVLIPPGITKGGSVKVFRLSDGTYSVVQGKGRGGSKVKVVGVYGNRNEAEKVARAVSKNVSFF